MELPFVWVWCKLSCCGALRDLEIAYIVPHIRSTHEIGANVVSPLELASYSTIICHFSTIIDQVIACKQRCLDDPVVGLVGPIRIGLVIGVPG